MGLGQVSWLVRCACICCISALVRVNVQLSYSPPAVKVFFSTILQKMDVIAVPLAGHLHQDPSAAALELQSEEYILVIKEKGEGKRI